MLPQLLAEAKRFHFAGDLAAAEQLYRQVIFHLPSHAETRFLLAACCHAEGQLKEAVDHYQHAVWLMPNRPEGHRNLALALQQCGRLPEAVSCIRQALELDPNDAEAHTCLADMLIEQGKYDEAAATLQEAIRLCPGLWRAYGELGRALQHEGRLAEAITAYEAALRLQPRDAVAWNRLGAVLSEQGKTEAAIAAFHEALKSQPDYAVAWHNLADLARQSLHQFPDAEVMRIKSVLAAEQVSTHSRGLLCFTLAYLSEKAGDFDQAFAYYRQAHACRRRFLQTRGMAFDARAHTAWVSRLITMFTSEYFRRVAWLGLDTELPIFVIGMPRSGTTLVEHILASHAQIHGAGELTDIQRMVADLPNALHATMAYPECLARVDTGVVRDLGERYVQRLRAKGGSVARVIDKMPENFFHLGLVGKLLPGARVIFCRRDALDTCVSCYTQNFRNLRWACDLQDLAAYYQQYVRLLKHWSAVLPVRKVDVQYEELVTNPEPVIRQLIGFCGLEWDERCLAPEKNPRAVQTASRLQVKQPIHAGSIGRWKKYERHLGPLIEALGE